jgi:hypothetical protein
MVVVAFTDVKFGGGTVSRLSLLGGGQLNTVDQVFGWGWSFHGSLGAGPSAIHTWPYRTPLLVQLP